MNDAVCATAAAALAAPGVLSAQPALVKETHKSFVFLTDQAAYKLKKPLFDAAGDAARLGARKHAAQREITLNRRLAASVYHGLAAIYRRPSGDLALRGPGTIIDWAIEMRRLDDSKMLDRLIQGGDASRQDLCRVATQLAGFYRSLPCENLSRVHFRRHFIGEISESHRVLLRFGDFLPTQRVDRLAERLKNFVTQQDRLLGARAAAVVEGHGDLRPEHICLEDTVVIFDCLDFSLRLRLVDPVDEIAFLAMECAALGAIWAEPILSDICARTVPGWYAPAPLVAFYKAVHAFTRARLAALHLEDRMVRTPQKWRDETRRRLTLAEHHAQAALETPVA